MTDIQDRLVLIITADANGALTAVKGFTDTASGELAKVEATAAGAGATAGESFSKNFATKAQQLTSGVGATLAEIGTGLFLKGSVSDAIALNQATAAFGAQIAATGDASGVTAGGIDRLAQSIQSSQLIFSTATKAAAAYLLTFDQIKNLPGQGNDIFNRTLDVSAGLSNVLGKDLQSVTAQVARALENPQSGLQALQRSGVAISQQDKVRIVDLAKQGDLLDAQKQLLDALEQKAAAGSAIAHADPIQAFDVELKQFKTDLGEGLLPAVGAAIAPLDALFKLFDAAPKGIQTVTADLAALTLGAALFARVAAPIQRTFGSIFTSGSNGSTEDVAAVQTKATTVAQTEQKVAVDENAIAVTNLDEALVGLTGAEAAANVAAQDSIAVTNEQTAAEQALTDSLIEEAAARTAARTAAEEQAGVSIGSQLAGGAAFFGTGAGVFAGAAALVGGYSIASQLEAPAHRTFENLQNDAKGVGDEIAKWGDTTHLSRAFSPGQAENALQSKADISTLTTGFENLADTQGPLAAYQAWQKFLNGFSDTQIPQVVAQFQPLLQYLDQTFKAEEAATQSTQDLASSIQGSLGPALASDLAPLKLADSFDAITAATDKVTSDKADIAGTSQKATDADQAEANALKSLADANRAVGDSQQKVIDSYTRLQDAQDSVRTSADSLLRAQQALDLYNSPRGAQERAYALDALNRRVVSTPAEEDQKQLSILTTQDSEAQKQQSLQDAVVSARKSERDAIKSVADAQRGIVDAARSEQDAVDNVKKAQQGVTDAVTKRKAVSDDAAKALIKDERDVKEKVDEYGNALIAAANAVDLGNGYIKQQLTALQKVVDIYAPGSDLQKGLDQYLLKIQGAAQAQQQAQTLAGEQITGRGSFAATPGAAAAGPLNNGLAPTFQPSYTPFADGGFEEHVAHIATSPRLFGEPETGGEAYIPLAGGKRDRSTSILVQVADHFGLDVVPKGTTRYADGGITGRSSPRVPSAPAAPNGGVVVHQTNHFTQDAPAMADLEYANRLLGWRLARSGRF